jgi:hypothetical protein
MLGLEKSHLELSCPPSKAYPNQNPELWPNSSCYPKYKRCDQDREINASYVFDPNKTDADNILRFTTDPGDEDSTR